MRKLTLLISLLLLPAALVFAQYGGYENREEHGGPSGGPGNRVSVEGCVFGEPGNLALLDDNGNSYELRGRTGLLNNYIGHRVRVDGRTWFRADNPYAMSENGEATPILRVYGTQRVSRRRCDQWGSSESDFRITIPFGH